MEVRLAEIDEDCQEELSHIIDAIYSQLEENVDVDKELITDSVKTVATQLPVSVIELARIPGMKELVMSKSSADIILGITQHYKERKNELLMVLVSKLQKKTNMDSQQRKDTEEVEREGQARGSLSSSVKTTNLGPITRSSYSTKVFVGGVPKDISWPTVARALSQFGNVWLWTIPALPHKGFLYFVFDDEAGVETLLANCIQVFKTGGIISYFYILHTRSGPKVSQYLLNYFTFL